MTTNRFPATCTRCGEIVPAGEGLVSGGKGSDSSWRVVHDTCLPPDAYYASRPWLKDLEFDL